MATQSLSRIENEVLEVVYGSRDDRSLEAVVNYGLRSLPVFVKHLSNDLPMEIVEKFERILKAVLCAQFTAGASGETAREIALFQKEIGFLFKYKSYSIKACSPLGYSIFIQNPSEGFSFQQHVSQKTEIFHILEVDQGSFVFICDHEDWGQVYDEESFTAWLSGQSDERYDEFKYEPKPGDVFIIGQLGVVHSVIGCVLEEFATTSTDMVDRLHDQNAGKGIPRYFNRQFARERLGAISSPTGYRVVEIAKGGPIVNEIAPFPIEGGQIIRLGEAFVTASCYIIEPSKITEFHHHEECAVSIYVKQGTGRLIMGDYNEVRRLTPPSVTISVGDLLIVPPGIYYGFVNEGRNRLDLSEHKIPFRSALS